MVDYGAILRVLRENGWKFLRAGRGDHQIWVNPADGRTISIDAGSKSRHLSNKILKELGIPKKF